MNFILNLHVKFTVKWILLIWLTFNIIRISKGQLCPANDGNPQTSDPNACYIYINKPQTYQQADTYCQNQYGGALVQTISNSQLNTVKSFAASNGASTVWLGAKQVPTGWKWADGTNPAYTYWHSESDYQYYKQAFTCAVINPNKEFFWTKDMCSSSAELVCEVATSSPNCVKVGVERTPLILNNRCFLLIQNMYKSWFEGQQYCKSLGGDIAKVDSQAIQDKISQELTASLWRRFWIGLSQFSFYWSTGQEVGTYFWEQQQPGRNGMCVVLKNDTLISNDYKWHTEQCDRQLPFICQTGQNTSPRVAIVTQVIPTKPTTTTTQKPVTTTIQTTLTPVRPDVVVSQTSEDKPDTGLLAGMSVLIVIVIAILVGLLIFFWYYTRRNRLLKKAARADAARLDAESNVPHPEFSNAGFKDEENPEDGKANIFTTSFTSTGRASKQRIYNVASESTEPIRENISRTSSTTSLQQTSHAKQPSPVNNPENFDHGLYQNVNSSKRSLKTDSEGTSENDDASSSRNRHKYLENGARSSKRRELGERGSRVRRSGSKVSPEIKPNYENEQNSLNGSLKLEQSGPLATLSTTGSMRRGNVLPPMELNQEEEQASQPKPRSRRYRTKDEANAQSEDNVRSSKKKHHHHHRRHRNDDADDQVNQHINNNSHEANNVQIELGSTHGYTSDDTPRDVAKSHRGRGSQRRVRVNKKKHDNPDHDSTSDHNSNPDSPKYPEQRTKRDKHLKKYKEQMVDESNYDNKNSPPVSNGYHENGNDYDEPYEEFDPPNKVDHDKTLYLETCNTLDNTSDVEVDIESLPDDFDGKQDIFV